MRMRPLVLVLPIIAALLVPSTTMATTQAGENFDGLTGQLQPRSDETGVPPDLLGWTHTTPDGWTVSTDASMTGKGVDEWRGWSFTTREFWSAAAPGQGRENFTKATGVLAVADNDEWDDGNSPGEQPFASTLTSPAYDVGGRAGVHVNFDSSYRQTGPQVAALAVSFDGGATQRLFEYSSAVLGDQAYLENRTLTQPVTVPAGATSMRLSWVLEKATNDWYWAIDNMTVTDQPKPGAEAPLPDRPGPEDVPDGISSAKVLYLDFDGIRYDKLLQANTPNLDALAAAGQFGPSYIQDNALSQTSSGPGHSNLLTGVWPDKHNVRDNNFTDPNIAEYPDFLTRLEQVDPGFSTFSTLDWTPINTYIIDAPDVKMQQTGDDKLVTDKQSTDDAVEALTTRNPDVVFVYLHDGDATGHALGSDSPDYIAAIENLDRRVGELVAAVRARETYAEEDWLIVAGTDHGFSGKGHGGDQHTTRTIWTLAAGGAVPVTGAATREWRQVDLAPTIFRHLDVPVQPAWGLDGVPIGTRSSDPFDTVRGRLRGVVDEPAKPAHSGGWTKQPPAGWSIAERTPDAGTTEYRGWSFMSGEFWTTSQEGEGRGSFVRARDVLAVADPDEWNDKGDPAAGGARFDSTLYTPWQRVGRGSEIDVRYLSHYKQLGSIPQSAKVVAEYDDGTTQVLWSADARTGARFDISRPMSLSTTAPARAKQVRIGWSLVAADNGYWAIDAPVVRTHRTTRSFG